MSPALSIAINCFTTLSDCAALYSCKQMLSLPVSPTPALPWAHQSTTHKLAVGLSKVSTLDTGTGMATAVLCTAIAWIIAVFILAVVVACVYHRQRHTNMVPVKVSETARHISPV